MRESARRSVIPGRAPRGAVAALRICAALLACTGPAMRARESTWTRLDAANFTIISQVSERETRRWAVEFEQFHRGVDKFMRFNEAALQPVTVVLFRSQDDLRPYKLLEKGKPANVDGMFFRSPLGNFIEVAADVEDEGTRQLIFHEGVHWLTNVSETPPPLWLDEGLAEVFSTFSIEDDLCNFGKALPWHVLLLNRGTMLPLKQLLGVQHGSLLYNEGERTSIFYAESWAFVHYLLFSGRNEERVRYNELVKALRPGTDPDAIFRQVFGVDCAAMDKRLGRYLSSGTYTINRIKFDRSAVEQSFRIRPASRAEVDLAQSSLLAAANRPAEALPRLRRITSEVPGNTAAWEAQGFANYQTEDYDQAEACFRRAAALGSRNYFVYSFLGDSTLGVRPGRITPTTGGDARVATDYYEHELALNHMDQHAYDNIAGNFYGLDPITDLDARTLVEGAALYPTDRMIQVGLGVVDLRRDHADAGTVSLRRIASDPSPEAKDASAYARSILEDRTRSEAADQMSDRWQNQDFAGVIAIADEMLKTEANEGNRESLRRTRDRAEVAMEVMKAVGMAGSGRLAEAKRLLLEADAKATDPQMKAQIQTLLDRIANAGPTRTSP